MKNYDFDSKDCIWLFSHTGINAVNIDVALEAKKRGMKVIVYGSAGETGEKQSRHSSGKNLFQLADIVVDSCVPLVDASVPLKNHFDKVGPLSTLSFVTLVWMTITTVAEILEERGVKLYIHPSHSGFTSLKALVTDSATSAAVKEPLKESTAITTFFILTYFV